MVENGLTHVTAPRIAEGAKTPETINPTQASWDLARVSIYRANKAAHPPKTDNSQTVGIFHKFPDVTDNELPQIEEKQNAAQQSHDALSYVPSDEAKYDGNTGLYIGKDGNEHNLADELPGMVAALELTAAMTRDLPQPADGQPPPPLNAEQTQMKKLVDEAQMALTQFEQVIEVTIPANESAKTEARTLSLLDYKTEVEANAREASGAKTDGEWNQLAEDKKDALRWKAQKDLGGKMKLKTDQKTQPAEEVTPEAKSPEAVKERGKTAAAAANRLNNALTESLRKPDDNPKPDSEFFQVNFWSTPLQDALEDPKSTPETISILTARVVNEVASALTLHRSHLTEQTQQEISDSIKPIQEYYQEEDGKNDSFATFTKEIILGLYASEEAKTGELIVKQIEDGKIGIEPVMTAMLGIKRATEQAGNSTQTAKQIDDLITGNKDLNPEEKGFLRHLLKRGQLEGLEEVLVQKLGVNKDMLKDPRKYLIGRSADIAKRAGFDLAKDKGIKAIIEKLLNLSDQQIVTLAKQRGLSDGWLMTILMSIGMLPQILGVLEKGGPAETQDRQEHP